VGRLLDNGILAEEIAWIDHIRGRRSRQKVARGFQQYESLALPELFQQFLGFPVR